jgi:hypothetical protein
MIGESAIVATIMGIPDLQAVFSLVPLEPAEWALVLVLATTGFIYTEATKGVMSLRHRQKTKGRQEPAES